MGLVHEQNIFLGQVVQLLERASDLGFVVTGGELFRTPEQQRIHVRAGRSRTMSSQHMKRLAIDLNFFLREGDGEQLCYDKDKLQPLGDFWESLDPANRWGGNWRSFKDTPHFERREGFVNGRANGHATNGHATNGHATNGHATNGHAANGHANGHAADAAEVNGHAAAPDARLRGLLRGAVGERRANASADVETVQHLLNNAAAVGRVALAEPLKTDGDFGPKTGAAILAYQGGHLGIAEPDGAVDPGGRTLRALLADVPPGYSPVLLALVMLAASEEQVARFAGPIGACFGRFRIDTPLRQAHFLAQIGHESGELRFQEEIASGAAYEGRVDLGNTQPGDGRRFKGRGLIQLTGRANYTRFAQEIGREAQILENPSIIASDLDLCVGAAGWYWTHRGINAHADRDDLGAVTKAINGGFNGIEHRRALLSRAKALYGLG